MSTCQTSVMRIFSSRWSLSSSRSSEFIPRPCIWGSLGIFMGIWWMTAKLKRGERMCCVVGRCWLWLGYSLSSCKKKPECRITLPNFFVVGKSLLSSENCFCSSMIAWDSINLTAMYTLIYLLKWSNSSKRSIMRTANFLMVSILVIPLMVHRILSYNA